MSLAHRVVLLFDELPKFGRVTIEALRQPLETRTVTIAQAKETAEYPAYSYSSQLLTPALADITAQVNLSVAFHTAPSNIVVNYLDQSLTELIFALMCMKLATVVYSIAAKLMAPVQRKCEQKLPQREPNSQSALVKLLSSTPT
ncbi:ATP-binding protein [Candidatus Saccharibacteria bacterium]|nr:MAG: ATP-binding protein [Candidatus Saccharibacteria bacterium]